MTTERVQRQIDRLLDEAEEAVSALHWGVVSERAQAVLAFDPENRDALAFLAAADRALGGVSKGTISSNVPSSGRSHPTSFNDERYVVKKVLGEGSSKRVFLVRDSLLDREVAFALIKTEGLGEVGRERILREARAMAKLGDHSNVIQLHDMGEEDGHPYMVLPLMKGGDLESLIKDAPGHRLPTTQVISVATDTCRGLEFAHSNGIVHRDLKPGNVWLTEDGVAKIGDFGLAMAMDHSRITQGEVMMGTLLYMSPEQVMGGEVGESTDLYSLGCLLYEMITGSPPFLGDDPLTIIGQHLNTPPVSPAWHNSEIPSGLETLILRLLEKDPGKRPASASEVRLALESIDVESARDPSLEEPATGRVEQTPVYRKTFVGRGSELHQLHEAFNRALSGEGSLAVVVGEPGIGKTSICEQLATYVALKGGLTLVGHCYAEGSVPLPYLAFVEAARSYIRTQEVDDLKREMGTGASEVARILLDVRERLDVEPSPPGDPEEARYRLMQAVASFLQNAATTRPLLLVLEDLHNADRGTLDMLIHMARSLSGTRLLIVGTYRDVEVHRGHPLSGALSELRRVTSIGRIVMRGLTAEEVQRMMSRVAARDISWELAEAVHQQTEGNPLFVQEVIRYLAEEGLLSREDKLSTGQWPLSISIPEGLRDVVGKRLSRLSPECNRVLRTAAVIGQEFRMDVLQWVVGVSLEELFTALEEAKNVAVIEEHSSMGGVVSFTFTHAFFRQTLYEENIAPRRIHLHQQVGRAIEEVYAGFLEEHAGELADHFANSSDPADLAKAVQYAEMAASRATAVYAYAEAARLLGQAVQVHEVLGSGETEKRSDLLLALGEVLMPAGDPQRAFATIAPQALALAEALDDRRRASMACQLALTGLMRYGSGTMLGTAEYRQWAERADEYADQQTKERVHADLALSAVRYAEERMDESWDLAQRALELARQMEDSEPLFFAALGILGRPRAPQHQEDQLQLAREFANLSRKGVSSRTLGVVLHLCGFAHLALGERDQAEGLWHDLEEIANRTRDSDLLMLSFSSEPIVATLDGHLEGALIAGGRLFAKAKELGSPVLGRQYADEATFRPLLYLGRAEQAMDALTRASEMAGLDPDWEQSLQRVLCLAHLDRRAEAQDALGELLQQRGFWVAGYPAWPH